MPLLNGAKEAPIGLANGCGGIGIHHGGLCVQGSCPVRQSRCRRDGYRPRVEQLLELGLFQIRLLLCGIGYPL